MYRTDRLRRTTMPRASVSFHDDALSLQHELVPGSYSSSPSRNHAPRNMPSQTPPSQKLHSLVPTSCPCPVWTFVWCFWGTVFHPGRVQARESETIDGLLRRHVLDPEVNQVLIPGPPVGVVNGHPESQLFGAINRHPGRRVLVQYVFIHVLQNRSSSSSL